MPPGNPSPNDSAPKQPTVIGPTVGIVVIVILFLLGAFYFWGEQLNRQDTAGTPYIPGDATASTTNL